MYRAKGTAVDIQVSGGGGGGGGGEAASLSVGGLAYNSGGKMPWKDARFQVRFLFKLLFLFFIKVVPFQIGSWTELVFLIKHAK